MCFGTTTPEGIINREINRSLKQERKLAPNSLTLLLLGTGESGKSTILKQFRILHANGFTDAEVEAFKHQIRVNIMHTIISLCRAANLAEFANNEQRRDAEFFASINGFQHELNTGLALKIDGLWNDPVIRDVYAKRATALQVQSNATNLLDSVMRVSACDYFPSEQDILWCKLRTVGVCELQFIQQGVKFKVLDLGGQRAERKKWHVFFQGVSALLYVVALDDYDLKLREDEKVNRMEDSLTLFSQICNMSVFNDTSIILFLNKKDLFKKKLAHSDLSVLFPDYPGGDYKFACSFIEEKYLEKLTTEKKIFTHFTCATSTKNIKHVFQDVRTSILISNLTATGF